MMSERRGHPLRLLDPNGLGMTNENQLHTHTVPYEGPRRAAGMTEPAGVHRSGMPDSLHGLVFAARQTEFHMLAVTLVEIELCRCGYDSGERIPLTGSEDEGRAVGVLGVPDADQAVAQVSDLDAFPGSGRTTALEPFGPG